MGVAVITDAMSGESFFPIWREYYGRAFGFNNLFVVNYSNGERISDPDLGGVWKLPVPFDEAIRPRIMSDLANSLLGAYEVVIRVDVDEVLVVDPTVANSLSEYLSNTDRPYYSARGLDVVQIDSEPPVGSSSILEDRSFAVPNSALNKTCITRIPIKWGQGFHWCDRFPEFGPVFMLHLKRIDVRWQLQWAEKMSRSLSGQGDVPSNLREYYRPDQEKIHAFHSAASLRPKVYGVAGLYRDSHQDQFLRSIVYNSRVDRYRGEYKQENVLCELPAAWKRLL